MEQKIFNKYEIYWLSWWRNAVDELSRFNVAQDGINKVVSQEREK